MYMLTKEYNGLEMYNMFFTIILNGDYYNFPFRYNAIPKILHESNYDISYLKSFFATKK